MPMKLENRIASFETKRQRKNFWIVLWKKADIIENKLSDYNIKGRIRKKLCAEVRPISYQMMIFVLFELSALRQKKRTDAS